MKKLIVIPLLFLLGCSPLSVFRDNEILSEMAVRAATARVLEEHPAWAAPAAEITRDAVKVLDGDPATMLASLEEFVLSRIGWGKLTAEEEELLRILIRSVRVDLERDLAERGVKDPATVKVEVAKVLGWIHQSAALRAGR